MPKLKEEPKTSKEATKETTKGWGAVAKRKAESDESQKNTFMPNFFLGDGESAIIQFACEEPYCMDGYNLKVKGKWRFVPAQHTRKGGCLIEQAGHKPTWRAAFKVLDYRGTWDKDKKKFKHDKPVERLWLVSNTVALQIKQRLEKSKDGLLENLVVEVSRTGSGKSDTTYNFERALDEDENPIKAIKDFEFEFGGPEEYCQPPTDAQLRKMGIGAEVESYDDDDDEDLEV